MLKTPDHKRFDAFAAKMRQGNLPEIAIRNFANHYRQLLEGSTGFIAETEIEPVNQLPDAEQLDQHYRISGEAALRDTVLIKLNGGLGTSMGLERAKSLIRVRGDMSFLDIIARHASHSRVALVLMNSFNTRDDSLAALNAHQGLAKAGVALDFLQHKVPKVRQDDLSPALSDQDPQLEWCPPGHGDIYIAMQTSGMLDNLIEAGVRYALISNSDNLGATLEASLLGYLVERQLPFLMEVTDRSEADKKGGHLARQPDGQFILRESAQCPAADKDSFEDIQRHRFFNTNNLWVDLHALRALLEEKDNIIDLPLIRNSKTLDPRNKESTAVYQLETAMGSAIQVFDGAEAIRVSRERFAPVKTTSDLLLVRSDVYEVKDNFTLVSRLPHSAMPVVELDADYYKMIDEFEQRFAGSTPSLIDCQRLQVKGDVFFGSEVTIRGKVVLENRRKEAVNIADGSVVDKNLEWD